MLKEEKLVLPPDHVIKPERGENSLIFTGREVADIIFSYCMRVDFHTFAETGETGAAP